MTVGNHFWYSLINISETLAGIDPSTRNADMDVVRLLRTVQQAYGKHVTPQSQFECYSVIILCGTLCKLLEKRKEEICDVEHTGR